MSGYNRNGHSNRGGRGRGRHYGHQQPQEQIPRNVEVRRGMFNLAEEPEFSPVDSLERKIAYIRNSIKDDYKAIVEGFQIGITQQPFKMPYWAVLLSLVTGPTNVESDVPWPNKILEDLVKNFQSYLDKLKWRELRLYLQFFAHLTVIGLITPESMLSQLSSFANVLDEPGVSYERAAMAAICVGEALLRAGSVLSMYSESSVSSILRALEAFTASLSTAATLSRPVVLQHSSERPHSNAQFDCLVSALRELEEDNFSYPAVLLCPQDDFPKLKDMEPSFELPLILVPPEIAHVDEETSVAAPVVRHRELPIVWVHLFEVEPSIIPTRAGGYLLRSAYDDVIDIYEINRKEAARILLDIDRWFTRGTFRTRLAPGSVDEATTGVQLELSVMETVLSNMLILPQPKHKPAYYHALITEVCKLSAATIGPAVGKSIRKIYGLLGEGLDVELARRFSDWFAVHMSNFAYQWVWKEWIPDLQLDINHPKRTFMRRTLELEIRLSYYDRIMKTLPEPMQSPDAQVMPTEVPGYDFEYESSSNSYYTAAETLQKKMKEKTAPSLAETSVYVDTIRTDLISSGLSDSHAASRTRSITMQCLLVLGSRSFSHFLNAIERYISILHTLSNTTDAKFEMLEIVSTFWRRNRQMILIVFDKLMQYQVVDPSDVVSWAFEGGGLGEKGDGLSTFQWELMRIALDKSNGRVSIAQRRVINQRKIDEEAMARAKAKEAGNEGMDVDDIAAVPDGPVEESADMQKQTRAHQILVTEQKAVLSRSVDKFVTVLGLTDEYLSEDAWNNRSSWTRAQWDAIETWGWFRHFTRNYAPHLRVYKESLSVAYLSRIPAERPSGALMREIWSIAIDQEF
ncbi:hypothetical protein M408DRAFT_331298 [Serendipita vermifera MAFF 305830]|uniref:MIF4G domain-containing protein n=1 Tax=Serendipita vermifera MAFF 305830 TaxID=933852 RepID=A0A0C3B106_SERVB|nr:hypothetical protein M408DRAFT_331298 [Serendipita vermifera MAFF 305830]